MSSSLSCSLQRREGAGLRGGAPGSIQSLRPLCLPKPPLNSEGSGLKARAAGSTPVVGGAGLIHLHKPIILVSGVVGGQDVHFIPPLGLFPGVGERHKKWGGNFPAASSLQPSLIPSFKTFSLYPLVVSEAEEPGDRDYTQ